MKHILILISFLHILFITVSCEQTKYPLEYAGENISELQKILTLYSDSISIKCQSARFIINNMAGHYFYSSSAIDRYRDFVVGTHTLTSPLMQVWWDSLKQNNHAVKLYDIQILTYDFIHDNIEQATKVWLKTPWHNSISDEIFFDYVLPYRVKDEPPSCIGWRDSLYNRYHHIISGINDVKIAFGKLHKYLIDEFKISNIGGYPYLLSAMDAGKMKVGQCIHRSAYIVAVMRALGIPATLDIVESWANFSTNGHSWVALVTNDGTYTVERNDSIARQFNTIDASVFHIKDTLESSFPYNVSFKKRVSKIWRCKFSQNSSSNDYKDEEADKSTTSKFRNPFTQEVNRDYGYDKCINIFSFHHRGYAYLCTFMTGHGWSPVAYTNNYIGCFTFTDLPDSVIFLPAYIKKGIIKALAPPFVITSNGKKEFQADTIHLQTMTIERKYPFSLIAAKSWPQAKDAYFEVSNDSNFNETGILYTFKHTPVFRNEINIKTKKKYRYIRYHPKAQRHAYISEIEVYSSGKRLNCKAFGKGISNPEACIDGDTYSYLDKVNSGKWVRLDFGKPETIDKIVLFPKNDGNNVVPGKYYELFCYVDGQWKMYGGYKSDGYTLVFKNVPSDGLYRLHCVEGGNEEQIFSYENGQQVWW